MARFFMGAVFGVVVTVVGGAALGIHAASDPVVDSDEQVRAAADDAGVDVIDLRGAMASTGLPARTYLRSVGELSHPLPEPAPPVVPILSARAACIIRHESGGNPGAVNPRSGAAGLGQFLRSTWATTPQGKAGLSVFDPAANRAAVEYMLNAGRAREFVAVTAYGC